MSEELKPCPFCGGEAERITLHDQDNFGGDVISCKKCECCTRVLFGEKEGLAESWNTRPALKAGQGEAVACLVRSRHMSTPARLAHDGKDHFTPWGEWEPGTLAYGEAVTDAGRNTPCLYEMRPIYTAPPASADAVSVPRELLERLCGATQQSVVSDLATLRTLYVQRMKATDELRALLAQPESEGVGP